jgi:hypothetical protein
LLSCATADNAFDALRSHIDSQLKCRPASILQFWIEGWDPVRHLPDLIAVEQQCVRNLASRSHFHFHMQFLLGEHVESWRTTIRLTEIPHIEFALDPGLQLPSSLTTELIDAGAVDVVIDGVTATYSGPAVLVYVFRKILQIRRLRQCFTKSKGDGESPLYQLMCLLRNAHGTQANQRVSLLDEMSKVQDFLIEWDRRLLDLPEQNLVFQHLSALGLNREAWLK